MQTFPSPNPLLEPNNPDAFFDPIWGWHLGDGPDDRAFQYDALADDVEPGSPLRGDLAFRILGNPLVLGDFDNNRVLDGADIDLLSGQLREGRSEPLFDLNQDGDVNQLDHESWIFDVFQTLPGDATLDRRVLFPDFLLLSNSFNEEGGWGKGDFTGDGFVRFPDFLLLSANFGKTAPSTGTNVATPEPSAFTIFIIGGCCWSATNRPTRTNKKRQNAGRLRRIRD